MSKKKKQAKPEPTVVSAPEEKKPISKKKLTVIIAIALAAVIIIGIVIGLIVSLTSEKRFDYINEDLSEYVYISESDYKNYIVNVLSKEITEKDVMREVNRLLAENKSKDPSYSGLGMRSVALTLGDVVRMKYRGYTVVDGVERELINTLSDGYGTLEIGTAKYTDEDGQTYYLIPGIDEALIGLKPSDYPEYSQIKTGTVQAGDVIYVSYEAILPDNTIVTKTNARIDLSREDLAKTYGEGFLEYFIGGTAGGKEQSAKEIGKDLRDQIILPIKDQGDAVYYNIRVEAVSRTEAGCIKIEVNFPEYYMNDLSLCGKAATFEIFIDTATVYDTPEWSDKFVLETLKVSESSLADFEGEGVSEKYESKIKKELEEQAERDKDEVIETQMWDIYNEKAEVKKYPDSEVKRQYDEYYAELLLAFEDYKSYYASVDSFALEYFGLGQGSDWRAYMLDGAKAVVKEKLVFFYVVQKENLYPTNREFEQLYEEAIENEIAKYQADLDACKTDAEREALKKELREGLLSTFGEEYFAEAAYYQYAIKHIIDFAVHTI